MIISEKQITMLIAACQEFSKSLVWLETFYDLPIGVKNNLTACDNLINKIRSQQSEELKAIE